MATSADLVQAKWDLVRVAGPDYWLVTQVEVLDRISPRIRGDFDCPHGPHVWLSVGAIAQVTHYYCRNCPKTRREAEWPSMRSLYGVYAS